jgi:hypothetical protein
VASKKIRTPGRGSAATQFKPGQSGNPAGKPKGCRNKLQEDMLAMFCDDWRQHGAAAIEAMRNNNPADYVKVAVALLPRQMAVEATVKAANPDDLTTAELVARLVAAGASASEAPGDPTQLN